MSALVATYCVDMSALIDGLERYYPESSFPSLWLRVDELIEAGRFICSDEVIEEAINKDLPAKAWCRQRSDFVGRLAAVAVVGLVVDDDDVLLVAEVAADAAHHLVGRLGERARRSCRPARIALVSLPAATFSRSRKAWKLVMTILAWPSSPESAGTISSACGSSCRGRWAAARAGGRGW